MKIGVLALQGDFDAHRRRLEELGAEVVLVKKPEQLDRIDGLVIPGGESGTFLSFSGKPDSKGLSNSSTTSRPSARAREPSSSPGKLRIPVRPDSEPSTSASAATPTDARWIAPSAKAGSSPVSLAISRNLRWRWCSSAPQKFLTSAKASK